MSGEPKREPKRRLPSSVRQLLSRAQAQAYAGADLGNAGRLAGYIWLSGTVLALALMPVFPPTAALERGGWLISAANTALVVVGVLVLRRRKLTFNRLYAATLVMVVQISVLEWLAGAHAPYDHLYLLPAAFVGAVHPPRRVLAFLVTVSLLAFAPLVYGGWNPARAAHLIIVVLLVAVASLLMTVLMSRVRAQRLALRDDQEFATMLARIDALTGLGNRRGFDEALKAELGAEGIGYPLLLLVGDINDFKQVNDRFGHIEGDRCLRQVASVVADTVRQGDLAFRWGGDEFVVLLPDADLREAERVAGRLEQAVESLCRRPDGETISLVWGVGTLEEGTTLSEAFRRADQGLFARKRGRNGDATSGASG